MDVTSIASVATQMSSTKRASEKQVAVLNKALDAQVNLAAGLIKAMPAPIQAQTPSSNLGQNINTTA